MVQLTLRVPDRLATDLKDVAAERGESVNAYAGRVLSAAVDPELGGSAADQLRERLARAGLLAEAVARHHPVADEPTIAAARAAAGVGRPLADLIREGRR